MVINPENYLMHAMKIKYHYSVRVTTKTKEYYKKLSVAENVSSKRNQDFWQELNKIRNRNSGLPDATDSKTD